MWAFWHCDMLGIAAAAGERPCGKRDHRGVSGRICVANRRRRSDLASHADAGPVSRGTIALSREVHAQRDWSGGVGLADRESASSVWAEFSADFFVRAVDRGGRRTHPRAYFATLPPRFDVSGFDALRPVGLQRWHSSGSTCAWLRAA